jgi:molybdate transport system substrate-binding protein
MNARRTLITLLSALLLGLQPGLSRADTLVVFAAASLTNALQEIGRHFESNSGHTVRFSFAASSALARQIEAGAQAQVFLSADEQWMDYLAARRLVVPTSRIDLLGNSLVLVTPAGSTAQVALRPGFDLAAPARQTVALPPAIRRMYRSASTRRHALVHFGVWQHRRTRSWCAPIRSARHWCWWSAARYRLGIVYATDAAVTPKVRVAGPLPG